MLDGIEHRGAEIDASYERLRAAVLGGQPDGFRLGHGVLATRGVLAWIAALSALAAPAPSASERSRPPAGEVLALPNAEKFVAVLAQMTLAHAA
ncbi:MAG: hypothetical protein ACLP01_09860 [Solirubrobacteraceae bacterium]